ncbi:unnamed protein product [Ilex paraguariensis]|uniref:Reticulon-like protein n=1 Tax=Ilex paraguariensis TaxID=185542 RepID=A0ABC8RBI3_9AQUA
MSDPVGDDGGGAMSDAVGVGSESFEEKIQEAVHSYHHNSSSSSSSSDSEDDKFSGEKFRLFGREKPVHTAFGGGKYADIILWRNKQISAGLLAGSTVIWLLFEWIGYHVLTFVCHSLILSLAVLFLWSNLSSFLHKAPLHFPEVVLPEDLFMSIALLLRDRINQAFVIFREVASGNDIKKFLYAIVGLWVLSVVGSWFHFLTLTYIIFVMVLSVPLLYEMHEDQVDAYAEKATVEIKKQYTVVDEKVFQKLPKVPFLKINKQH